MTYREEEPAASSSALRLSEQLHILRTTKMAKGNAATADSNSNGANGTSGYVVQEKPLGSTKHIRIVSIGAGASGLNMIRTLRKSLTNFEHVVYEKNANVGGTWLENRYPGCRCDIPSHNYQFSWRPKKDWSNFCAPANEIEDYLCQICKDEDMARDIRLQHKVVGMDWNEGRGIWRLKVHNLASGEEFDDLAHFVIDATGILNNWRWPDVPRLHDFKGTLIHSANWPEDFDYRGKSVALIGNGSSGVQIVPAIRPDVKQLFHFIRSPTWVLPPRTVAMKMGPGKEILSQIQLDKADNFTPEQIEKFKNDSEAYRRFVKATEKEVNSNFPLFIKGSPIQTLVETKVREYMTAMLGGDERLCKALIPNYALGCRRLTPAPGYLACFREPNMTLVVDKIAEIVPEGIRTETGEIIKVDIIICATGFDVSFKPRFPIIGRDGNMQERWEMETPKAYMSCALAGVPNYFTVLGPNAPIAHGSVFTLTEHIAKYLVRIIQKCQTEGIKAIAPSPGAVADYFEHITKFMPRTTWSGGCTSWFKNGTKNGPVTAVHPGSRVHFFHMLKHFRGEDWEYVYDEPSGGNRFAYLGNGFSTIELDPGIDSTWYLDEEINVALQNKL